ncbi:hypothetical protein V6R21_20925 [Limibacter armeniacum]|uniref:hypothetical protein n=1 Tax=Limibacter armeniacum TaxID=466084 RepID=UPI002FE63399
MRIRFIILFLLMTWQASAQTAQEGLTGAISVERGARIFNHPEGKVDIQIRANGATHMKVSRDESFRGVVWEPFSSEKRSFPLVGRGEGDGVKFVYVMFKDGRGNVSSVISYDIELDRTPPQNPSVMINGGMPYTNNKGRVVSLMLGAEDASYMKISGRPDFHGAAWAPYNETINNYRLIGIEGKKEVFVQYKDAAGNVSETVTASIILDFTPPLETSVKINNGEKFAKDNQVKLQLHAKGATQMQIRGGEGWVAYQEEVEWLLPSSDGEKVVFARFMDEAGNVSGVARASIFIDKTPPQFGKVIINKGKRYIESNTKQPIQLFVQGATEMMVSNNESFSGADWQPYRQIVPTWTFTEGDGEKTVYVKFRDQAGNESEVYFASVKLDSTPPSSPGVKIVSENAVYDEENKIAILKDEGKVVDLELHVEDALFMMISNVSSFYGATWQPYRPKVSDWHLDESDSDGRRSVYVKYMDRARNVSETVRDQVIVDNEPPIDCKVVIDNQAPFATDKEKNVGLSLFARHADFVMISNDPTFNGAEWKPYSEFAKWQLEGDDGLKTVFVKYKDIAGNESQPVSDNIMLDREPPQNISILINKGAEVTNNPDKAVQVKVTAKDAVKMKIGHTPDMSKYPWRGYNPYNIGWKLAGGDGVRSVYAFFQDEAGNISKVVGDSILLDTKPPYEGTIAINENSKLSNSNKVILELAAVNAKEMQLSRSHNFTEAEWIPFKPTMEYMLGGGDGVKMIFVRYRDAVGNVSKPVYAKIGVDTSAPEGGYVYINKRDDKYCTDVDGKVTLRITARGATKMMLSNSNSFENAEWQKYQDVVYDYYLDAEEDGKKVVYYKFSDDAGNETTPGQTSSIILDRQEPVRESIVINNGEEFTSEKSGEVVLTISAEGAKDMVVSNDRYFRTNVKWEPYGEEKKWRIVASRDGAKYVYVKFRDDAGNESAIAEAKIILDTTPPIPQFVKINDGATAVDNNRVTLSIQARGDVDMMQVSNSPTFDDGALWQPYNPVLSWDLPPGPGLKRVYVRFKDKAQNESGYKWAETTLYEGK